MNEHLVPDSVPNLIRLINKGDQFALARYGDGEWACIFDKDGKNCDDHQYFPDMREAMRQTLIRGHTPPYYYGHVRIADIVYGQELTAAWSVQNEARGVKWVHGTIFRDAAGAGELFPLIDCLREKSVMVVGPSYMDEPRFWTRLFMTYVHVTVPELNCWLERERIEHEIRNHWLLPYVDVIAFSAGMTSNIIMHSLWSDINKTMIDFGSLWDVFLGRPSRSYQREMTKDIYEKNLHG